MKYELAKLMSSGLNHDMDTIARHWMPWGIQERKWTTHNSYAECNIAKNLQPKKINDGWKKKASQTNSWMSRHSERVGRDGGIPTPLAFASFCEARGRHHTMETFMHVLASDGHYPCDEDLPKVRWEYCYDTHLDEDSLGGYPSCTVALPMGAKSCIHCGTSWEDTATPEVRQ